jgi:single-strand DNA-binding protein
MNAISLSGHLTHDPKLVYRNGRPICEMRLAVDNDGRKATFIDMPTFDGHAYACAEHLRKGSKVAVSGRLIYDEWHNAEGAKRSRYSVVGWVEFLDYRSHSEKNRAIEEVDFDELEDEDIDEETEPQLSLVA